VGLILDTNALSALAEGDRGAGKEVARAEHADLPVIVLGEYRFGISQLRRKDEHVQFLKRFKVW
jgi:tRNA(fMet)-specific endonuclease VapC